MRKTIESLEVKAGGLIDSKNRLLAIWSQMGVHLYRRAEIVLGR